MLKLTAMKSMSFTVFNYTYNATVLVIQPNPTHGWTQPMSICGFTRRRCCVFARVHAVALLSLADANSHANEACMSSPRRKKKLENGRITHTVKFVMDV